MKARLQMKNEKKYTAAHQIRNCRSEISTEKHCGSVKQAARESLMVALSRGWRRLGSLRKTLRYSLETKKVCASLQRQISLRQVDPSC
jgi:hypothetical protein